MVTLTFPRSDTELLRWSQNLLGLITASPTSFNLVAGDATAYNVVHTAYPAAPADISLWKFEGNVGQVKKIDVIFSNTLAGGSKVWLTAFWFNGRKQSGPLSNPFGVALPGGSVAEAA